MYYKLDSVLGIAPSVIGKDRNGFWHVYSNPNNSVSTASFDDVTAVGNSSSRDIVVNTVNIGKGAGTGTYNVNVGMEVWL